MEDNNVNGKMRKSNTGIIVILVLIILCMAGYIAYDKLISNDSNIQHNNESTQNESAELPVEEEKVDVKSICAKYYDKDKLEFDREPLFKELESNGFVDTDNNYILSAMNSDSLTRDSAEKLIDRLETDINNKNWENISKLVGYIYLCDIANYNVEDFEVEELMEDFSSENGFTYSIDYDMENAAEARNTMGGFMGINLTSENKVKINLFATGP